MWQVNRIICEETENSCSISLHIIDKQDLRSTAVSEAVQYLFFVLFLS